MRRLSDAEVVGVLILLGMLKLESEGIAWGDGWHKPVPDLFMDGKRFPAIITSGFHVGRHRGVDIMFRRKPGELPSIPADVPDAEGAIQDPQWFAPIGTPILAARDGVVWSVDRIAQGGWIVLDHGKPWATSYHHLRDMHVKKGERVTAGQQIGTMGFNPNQDPSKGTVDHERLRHLHFEPWYKGGNSKATVDPATVMSQWGTSLWTP